MLKKSYCYALQDKRNRYVQDVEADPQIAFRTLTFRTKRDAIAWLSINSYWKTKASVVKVKIKIEGMP